MTINLFRPTYNSLALKTLSVELLAQLGWETQSIWKSVFYLDTRHRLVITTAHTHGAPVGTIPYFTQKWPEGTWIECSTKRRNQFKFFGGGKKRQDHNGLALTLCWNFWSTEIKTWYKPPNSQSWISVLRCAFSRTLEGLSQQMLHKETTCSRMPVCWKMRKSYLMHIPSPPARTRHYLC